MKQYVARLEKDFSLIERYENGLFQNIPGNKDQGLFESAVKYFTGK